jgi:translation initiation factor IF-2
MAQHTDSHNLSSEYPPVVAVLGHVDHGKTTLLDAMRKSSIAQREFGGITQKIGASSVAVMHEEKTRTITFIDTPGHELFAQMRSRGAQAADIGLLIVSAVDGVMPQTRESISVLKASGIPYIVVLTMSDMETKNPERAKQQLLKEEITLEEYGGDTPLIEVSAKTNLNIQELLDLILLVWDVRLEAGKGRSASDPVHAIIIESRLDQKSGPRATAVIKRGTMHVRDVLQSEAGEFKVRTLISDTGAQLPSATVGEAVEILGLEKVPAVGSVISSEKTVSAKDVDPMKNGVYSPTATGELAVVLVADTQGSVEAISAALPEEVTIVSKKTGEITEADILLAKSINGIVLGFNSKLRPDVQKLATTEKVLARNYQIVYEMIDEIKDVLEGKRLAGIEQVFGQAQVLAKFPFEKTFVLGIKVLEGRVARGDKARIMRGETEMGEGSVTSLRIGKNPSSKVEKGHEAGIIISPVLDFQPGDMVICHS